MLHPALPFVAPPRDPRALPVGAGGGVPAAGGGDRIVPAQGDGPARQTGALGDLAWAIGQPAVDLAPEIAPRGHRIGRREIRVAHEREVELTERPVDRLP